MNRKVEIPEPPESLSLTQEAACFVVLKAREFDVKVDPVESHPGSNATDSDVSEVLSDYSGDGIREELVAAIDALNEDQKAEIVALAWIGRGDYDVDDWEEAVTTARQRHTGSTHDYLLGIPRLGDHLEEGLSQLGLSCVEDDAEHSGAPNPREGID